MATDIQSIRIQTIGATTTYEGLNSISVLNQSTDDLEILNITMGGGIELKQGQSVTITSSTGFVLPKLMLDSSGTINASVITT
jgi:hypothetical protein